ncbi:MAG: MBL fold metallo-hydrolase [Pirellulaceae bacterium]|jgi:ribonuclease Z|nr:MBL fold metallo-hydrolase [Pirellulaceae bacterium]MDP7014911.1 MBL fold metallo-hydrolase [Pirellulaceae bacterium]
MVENAPVITHKHGELTIEGYSRAAVQSYWRIPELKLGFDLGAQPWDFMGTPTWFVSHSHLDHIAALPVYVARRRMMKMDPPTIYLPEHALDGAQQMLRVVSRLDRGRLPCQLLSVAAGDEIDLSRELAVTAHATKHTVPSLGYIVWRRKRKLKAEYTDLGGDEIRDLRLSGVEVSDERREPILAYLGDSAPEGLDDNPDMFRAKVLISELTFVAPDHRKEKIHKHGHMHLDDYVERRDKFENEVVIAGHFSTRYHDRQIRSFVERKLPDMLDGRLRLWL